MEVKIISFHDASLLPHLTLLVMSVHKEMDCQANIVQKIVSCLHHHDFYFEACIQNTKGSAYCQNVKAPLCFKGGKFIFVWLNKKGKSVRKIILLDDQGKVLLWGALFVCLFYLGFFVWFCFWFCFVFIWKQAFSEVMIRDDKGDKKLKDRKNSFQSKTYLL